MAGYEGQQTANSAPFLWLKGQTQSLVVKVNARRVQGEIQLVGEGV